MIPMRSRAFIMISPSCIGSIAWYCRCFRWQAFHNCMVLSPQLQVSPVVSVHLCYWHEALPEWFAVFTAALYYCISMVFCNVAVLCASAVSAQKRADQVASYATWSIVLKGLRHMACTCRWKRTAKPLYASQGMLRKGLHHTSQHVACAGTRVKTIT